MSECVILLHGIFDSGLRMLPLARFLKSNGYSTNIIDYPSTRHNIDELADYVESILPQAARKASKLHFVGFSMGGLVIRSLLARHRPRNLGRVVMLGTPNNGSEVADALKSAWLFQSVYGPAGQQLSTDTVHAWGDIDYELGIIAGDYGALQFVSDIFLPRPHDGKVSVESTKLPGMKDHLVISASHLFMLQHPVAKKAVLNFLQTARFS